VSSRKIVSATFLAVVNALPAQPLQLSSSVVAVENGIYVSGFLVAMSSGSSPTHLL
jgi:hypothetical protein